MVVNHGMHPDDPHLVDVPFGPQVGFVYKTNLSRKLTCTVCGAQGYGPSLVSIDFLDTRPAPWQAKCLQGHKQCSNCDRWMRLKKDGVTVMTHTRCIGRSEL